MALTSTEILQQVGQAQQNYFLYYQQQIDKAAELAAIDDSISPDDDKGGLTFTGNVSGDSLLSIQTLVTTQRANASNELDNLTRKLDDSSPIIVAFFSLYGSVTSIINHNQNLAIVINREDMSLSIVAYPFV